MITGRTEVYQFTYIWSILNKPNLTSIPHGKQAEEKMVNPKLPQQKVIKTFHINIPCNQDDFQKSAFKKTVYVIYIKA